MHNILFAFIYQHDMKQYLKKLWNSFLDTEPDCYVIPSSSTKDVKKVELLKPNVRAAHIHVYPSEHAVVLEGENLSFCYAVQLGEMKNVLKIDTPALITPNMIRFNFPPNDKTRQIKVRKSDKTMKVVLFSHFSKRIQQRVEVNEVSNIWFILYILYYHICIRMLEYPETFPSLISSGSVCDCHSYDTHS